MSDSHDDERYISPVDSYPAYGTDNCGIPSQGCKYSSRFDSKHQLSVDQADDRKGLSVAFHTPNLVCFLCIPHIPETDDDRRVSSRRELELLSVTLDLTEASGNKCR